MVGMALGTKYTLFSIKTSNYSRYTDVLAEDDYSDEEGYEQAEGGGKKR
jgi:hypothetical protein